VKPKAKHKIGRMVQTTRLVPGAPVGLPCGAWVEVQEIKRMGRGVIRYCVKSAIGVSYWVDDDAIEELGAPKSQST
jgi:hypothetical protein